MQSLFSQPRLIVLAVAALLLTALPLHAQTGPQAIAFSPGDGLTDVDPADGKTLEITFDDDLLVNTGSIRVKLTDDGALLDEIDVTSDRVTVEAHIVTVTLNIFLNYGTDYTFEVDAGAFENGAGDWSAAASWSFTTVEGTVGEVVGNVIKLTPPIGELDGFGRGVAIHDDTAVVLKPYFLGDGVSALYVFRLEGDVWNLVTQLFDPEGGRFGYELATDNEIDTDGNQVVTSGDYGYVFAKNASGYWEMTARLQFGPGSFYSRSNDASIDGNVAVFGNAFTDAPYLGLAYVFEKDENSTWQEVAVLNDGEDEEGSSYFGHSVGVSGDTIVVGDPTDDPNAFGSPFGDGALHIFQRDENGSWNQVKKYAPDFEVTQASLGYGVSIDGDILAGTAPMQQSEVHILQRSSLTSVDWDNVTVLVPPDPDQLGPTYSVAIDHNVLVGGFTKYVDSTLDSSYLPVYQFTDRNVWQQIINLTNPDDEAFGAFAMEVSGSNVINASSGAAYIFNIDYESVDLAASDALSPDTLAVDVNPTTDLTITFAEPVQANVGGVFLVDGEGNPLERIDVTSERVTINGAMVTIDPATLLAYGTDYEVIIEPGAFVDLDGNPFAGLGSLE